MRIRVYNVAHGETVSLHLPLLLGDIDCLTDNGEIAVWNSSQPEHTCTTWPVIDGAFKVLVLLLPGQNNIHLKFQDEILQLTIVFSYSHLKHFVRPVYIVCSDDDGYFQGPDGEDCSLDSALERIKLAAMLIQTFTAEKMKEHGFGRQTFQLEINSNFEPLCRVFHSNLTLERAHSMSGSELWAEFARELMTSSNFADKDLCKWYCFMSFTRYDPPSGKEAPTTHTEILRHTKGHTALGGGGLALFGTGNLHTWAASVDEIYKRFTDTRKIDRTKLMDDSAYREYHWANYATGLGASLHELGHTFDLAHTPSGIMARGFDDLHKVFIVQRSKSTNGSADRLRNGLRISRSLSSDSTGDGEISVIEHNALRYKDVCYGSPYRKVPVRRNSTSNAYIAPPPLMFNVESGFRPATPSTPFSISVRNYDGSETRQTIFHDPDTDPGSEVTVDKVSQLLTRSNRERRPSASSSCSSVSSTQSSTQSPTRIIPSMLPNSPSDAELCVQPYVHYVDDGAHWYRASAVLLRFHKWFNKCNSPEVKKHMTLTNSRIKSSHGFRLVELRSDPAGVVFHHWEFLSKTPPTEFTIKASRIKNLPPDAKTVTLLAEDDRGNVFKKRLNLCDLGI